MNKAKRLIVGNWKMNGSRAWASKLLADIGEQLRDSQADVAVCVPFPFLELTERSLNDTTISWGAQNLSERQEGAFTGEVSALMLRDFGCRYVIVGHSERRTLQGESDRLVALKTVAALERKLRPIICVGESLEERDAGQTQAVVLRQLDAVLTEVGRTTLLPRLIVAYEPLWAIGTGRNATPEQAQAVHAAIRERIARNDAAAAATTRILYGGSVKPATAGALFAQPDIDGALIGGASLVAQDFVAVANAGA